MEVPELHLAGDSPRSYHTFSLFGSSLKCCVISDPHAEKAAASVAVAAGQLHDTMPGIAHLTEHLVFMGSTSFPVENEYDTFLQQNGGHSNAYTDLEVTCFYFDVAAAKLHPALDRLASALSEPLLKVDSLERELQAVDSEHAKNITQDHWRIHQLSRQLLGGNNHPFSNFGTGNKESLLQEAGQDEPYATLREQIVQFYQTYYTASNITLAVLGSQTVDELQAMVTEIFAKMKQSPADNSVPRANDAPALDNLQHVTVVEWVPLRGGECSLLDLQWILPESQYDKYRSKPSRFWSHLLGHEGPGTLLAVLRDKGWAQDLTADDVSTTCRNFSLFHVSLELTSSGLEHVVDILVMLYYYIDTILERIPEWVYDELKVTGDTAFRFLSKGDAAHTCSSLAVHMHQYEETFYLSGAYKLYDSDPEAVQAIGQTLRSSSSSNNLLVMLGSSEYEKKTNQVDQWYGTKYRVVPNDDDQHLWKLLHERLQTTDNSSSSSSSLTKDLALPAPNDMLPTDFTLHVRGGDTESYSGVFGAVDSSPRCWMDTPTCRLWYKADWIYQTPKVNVIVILRSPILTLGGPEASVLGALWVEVTNELCNEFAYAASMAGLHCGFQDGSTRGLEFQITGYNHKAAILLRRVCERVIVQFETIGDAFFERVRAKVSQHYHSALAAQPYQHASMAVDLVLEAFNKGFLQQRLEYLENGIVKDDLLRFSKQLLGHFQLEALVHGNVTAADAKNFCTIILEAFQPTAPLKQAVLRGVQLPASCSLYRFKSWNEHDDNSCVANIYQIGKIDIRTNAVVSLLAQLIREPAFNVLRTEEQLGYIVFTQVKTSADHIKSLMLLIQSDSYDPVHMNERIEAFLVTFRTHLLNMSEPDFQTNVNGLCESLLERNKNLGEESSKHWSVITNQTYHFTRLADIASHVRTLDKFDVLCLLDRYILAESPYRRKLSVQLFGTNHHHSMMDDAPPNDEECVIIDNPDVFARTSSLFPAPEQVDLQQFMLDL